MVILRVVSPLAMVAVILCGLLGASRWVTVRLPGLGGDCPSLFFRGHGGFSGRGCHDCVALPAWLSE